ncbi:superinfection immunity protein, partial [Acidithiobacillus ferridurans]|nr:superinfection immunity protein [Acidithiobacillus ferridurans]
MLHWIADSRGGFVTLLLAACIVAMAIYALPALLAWSMGSPQRMAITLLDLLLGWTILGWIAALIWAVMSGNGGSFDEDPPPRREPW